MKKLLVHTAKLLLLVLFLSYYGGSTLFFHTHHFSWGTLTHSHPFQEGESSRPGHSHSPGQCQTLSAWALLLLLTVVAGFAAIHSGRPIHWAQGCRAVVARHHRNNISLRAPPLLVG